MELFLKYKLSIATIGGIILLLAGVISLFSWIGVIIFDSYSADNLLISKESIVIIECILSIFPIFGGIFAIKKTKWIFCIIFGVIGLFTIGPLFISTILSLISIFLITKNRKEFH